MIFSRRSRAAEMTVHIQSISTIDHQAKDLLIQGLGVVDTLRFLNQFRHGHGDYTREREALFEGETVKSIVEGIKSKRLNAA